MELNKVWKNIRNYVSYEIWISNAWDYTDPEFLSDFLTFFERHQNTILIPLSKCNRTLHQLNSIMTGKDKSINLSWLILILSFVQQSQQKLSMPNLHSVSRPTQHNSSHELLQTPHFYIEHFFVLLCLQILTTNFTKWPIVWHLLCPYSAISKNLLPKCGWHTWE